MHPSFTPNRKHFRQFSVGLPSFFALFWFFFSEHSVYNLHLTTLTLLRSVSYFAAVMY